MRRLAALSAMQLVLLTNSTPASDFRIETRIYAAEEEKPVGENLTLFQSGVVYDFGSEPKAITIFRPPSEESTGRFVALDPERGVKIDVTTDKIEKLLGTLQEWAAGQDDSFVRFLAHPEFVDKSSSTGDPIILASEHMTYHVQTTHAISDEALALYRQFSDWYARFNSRGGMLPFPRLAINDALYRHKRIPTRVKLTIPAQGVNLRTEHRVTWRLSKQDRKQIEEALKQMSEFRTVEPDEFFRSRQERVAAASAPEK